MPRRPNHFSVIRWSVWKSESQITGNLINMQTKHLVWWSQCLLSNYKLPKVWKTLHSEWWRSLSPHSFLNMADGVTGQTPSHQDTPESLLSHESHTFQNGVSCRALSSLEQLSPSVILQPLWLLSQQSHACIALALLDFVCRAFINCLSAVRTGAIKYQLYWSWTSQTCFSR